MGLKCERIFAINNPTSSKKRVGDWNSAPLIDSAAYTGKTKNMKRTKTTGVSRRTEALKKRPAKKAGRKGPPKSRPKKKAQKKKKSPETLAVYLKTPGAPSGRQSGDLQGLSTHQGADSESVTELLEEGNPFEAGVVSGVEAAESDESEVRTHEVPQDDVPGEYLDEVQRRYRSH